MLFRFFNVFAPLIRNAPRFEKTSVNNIPHFPCFVKKHCGGMWRVAQIWLCVYNRPYEQIKANNLYCNPDLRPVSGLRVSG
jgi:hypothetical protein